MRQIDEQQSQLNSSTHEFQVFPDLPKPSPSPDNQIQIQATLLDLIDDMLPASLPSSSLKKPVRKDPLEQLIFLKENINNKMTELSNLNSQFYQKQEKMFLKTFVNMMDRMSNQILHTREKLNNIDEQIEQMPECVQMREKMKFFKDECLLLRAEMKQQEKQLEDIRNANDRKQEEMNRLQEQLKGKIVRSSSYKKRKYSLQSKLDQSGQKDFNQFLTEHHSTHKQITSARPRTQKHKQSFNHLDISVGESRKPTTLHEQIANYKRIIMVSQQKLRGQPPQKNNKVKKTLTVGSSHTHRGYFTHYRNKNDGMVSKQQ